MNQFMTVQKILFLFIVFSLSQSNAQQLNMVEKTGTTHEITYRGSTVNSKGLKLNDGSKVGYDAIEKISTADFDAYEKLIKKTPKSEGLTIEFTGDQNAYASRLEELRKRRSGADAARATGGMMTILGVISGNRDLTAAGLATSAAGQVARVVNEGNTSNTQTAMNNDMEQRNKGQESEIDQEEMEIELMRNEFGKENVDGLIELVDGNHDKAQAYANVGELSKDANHRVASVWLKAMIEQDRGDKDAAEEQYERLVTLEPDMKDSGDVKKETKNLLKEVDEIRMESE